MVNEIDKSLVKALSEIKDVNFIKGIFGLLKNDVEKTEMTKQCNNTKDLSRSLVEYYLLQIVRKRNK